MNEVEKREERAGPGDGAASEEVLCLQSHARGLPHFSRAAPYLLPCSGRFGAMPPAPPLNSLCVRFSCTRNGGRVSNPVVPSQNPEAALGDPGRGGVKDELIPGSESG